ncbi:MAG TPA: type II toxin-antitoxin system death-on-curing family toxin [Candidatus Fournierella excrementigallinarum]|nr:type II toxin-antitoxin system death-on-curing family toxin [Candidatus Fournierella excrementigallinarum]
MKTLSKRQVLLLHSSLIEAFGGSDGVRDEGLLESALAAPFQTFGGEPVYPSMQSKAAQLGFGLIRNHPFVDGNKRVGAHVMLVFLELNGIVLHYEQQELIDIILSVASGEIDRKGLLQWILEHE